MTWKNNKQHKGTNYGGLRVLLLFDGQEVYGQLRMDKTKWLILTYLIDNMRDTEEDASGGDEKKA